MEQDPSLYLRNDLVAERRTKRTARNPPGLSVNARMTTAEELQTLVLTTLDRNNVIQDSKDLKTVHGDELDQLALLGVLNSLKSKEVQRMV